MSSLITRIDYIEQAKYGVNILDKAQPSVVVGRGSNTIGKVGAYPWGPVNEPILCTSPEEFFNTFAPIEFANRADYPSLLAMLGKTYPAPIYVVRIEPTDSETASYTFVDAGTPTPENSVVVTARYPGESGNLISVAWSANPTVAGNRDMTVTVTAGGNITYQRIHRNVVVATGLVVTDPNDPWVIVTPHADIEAVPAPIAATALAGGDDGTAVLADWTGGSSGFNGLRAFLDDNLGVDVIFGAEVPSSMAEDWNAALYPVVEAVGAIAIYSTEEGMNRAAAIATAAANPSARAMQPWPKVYIRNTYLPVPETVLADGNAFQAVAVAGVNPFESPGSEPGARYLRGIVSLETGVSKEDYELLYAGGVSAFRNSPAMGGYMIGGAVSTQTADPNKVQISRQRAFDFITGSVAEYMERFIGRLADINLTQRRLGPITQAQASAVEAFMASLVPASIEAYSVDWFSANTPQDLALNRFQVILSAKLYGVQDRIIIHANVGSTVTFEQAA